MRPYRLASFDVFDTCLTRRAAAPSEVFRATAQQLVARGSSGWEDDFIAARREAESRVRRAAAAQGIGEVTLEEIWEELAAILGSALPEGDAQIELAAESVAIVPVALTLQRIARERASGRRIAFISDTYLPASFVREQLAVHGFWQEGDGLYVSSACRITKGSGALFHHLLACERVAATEVLHYGDHPDSDVAVPARLGFQAVHCTTAARSRPERVLLECAAEPGLTRAAVGELRAARASTLTPSSAARKLVEDFVGPFVSLWGHWIISEARQQGLSRLYFAARDARLLSVACEELLRAEKARIECRYLRVSRQALLLPASDVEDYSTFSWLRRDFEPTTLASVARQLEIAPDVLHGAWTRHGGQAGLSAPLQTEKAWGQLERALAEPEVAQTLRATIAARRAGCRVYFQEQGLLEHASCGFVDLGWYLTCQAALNRLVTREGRQQPVVGLYFGLKQGRRGPAEAGPATAIFRWPATDLPQDSDLRALAYRETLLEHIVGLADEPTVSHYDSSGTPVFAAKFNQASGSQIFSGVREALSDYIGSHGHAWKDFVRDERSLRRVLASLCADFFAQPNREIVELLRTVNSSRVQGKPDDLPLAHPYSAFELLRSAGTAMAKGSWSSPPRVWPEASRSISTWFARRLLALGPSAATLHRPFGRAHP